MNTLTRKLTRWLDPGGSEAAQARWRQLAADTGGTSQAEWHLSGRHGQVAWSLPNLFAEGEVYPRQEYLGWQASGLPVSVECEIVSRAQYDDWVARSTPGAPQDAGLVRALSVFAETLGFEPSRFAPWEPAAGRAPVVDLGPDAVEDFVLGWVVIAQDPLTARRLASRRVQVQWLQASRLLTDARGQPASDLRLCVRGGTAQLHTTRAHRNMPLEAVQALVDLGLVLLDTLGAEAPAVSG